MALLLHQRQQLIRRLKDAKSTDQDVQEASAVPSVPSAGMATGHRIHPSRAEGSPTRTGAEDEGIAWPEAVAVGSPRFLCCDTCVLLSHLDDVRYLLTSPTTPSPRFRILVPRQVVGHAHSFFRPDLFFFSCVFVIRRQVLCELEGLKSGDDRAGFQARCALRFIEQLLVDESLVGTNNSNVSLSGGMMRVLQEPPSRG